MEFVILITICLLLAIEGALMMFCKYWRENNPWKWFFIKTFTTLLIIFYIVHDMTTFGGWDMMCCGIIGVCLGIDLTITIIEAKEKNKFDF